MGRCECRCRRMWSAPVSMTTGLLHPTSKYFFFLNLTNFNFLNVHRFGIRSSVRPNTLVWHLKAYEILESLFIGLRGKVFPIFIFRKGIDCGASQILSRDVTMTQGPLPWKKMMCSFTPLPTPSFHAISHISFIFQIYF